MLLSSLAFLLCVQKDQLLHIGCHFSLRKWWRRSHFPTKLAAVASFSYKIGCGGLIFLQNWRRRQGFGNITGCCSDMVWILGQHQEYDFGQIHHKIHFKYILSLFVYYSWVHKNTENNRKLPKTTENNRKHYSNSTENNKKVQKTLQ